MNQIFNKKWGRVSIHVLAWLIVLSLPYLFRYSADDRFRNDPEWRSFVFVNALTNLLWIVCFYLNAFLLFPRLVYAKRYLLYIVTLVAIFLATMVVHGWIFKALIDSRQFIFTRSAAFNLPAYVLTIAASIAYRLLNDRAINESLEQQKQAENLKTELSFLRSQISPHFVFNILNNITALARLKSAELEPTIMKLSSLMRYMLYETNEEKVSLQTEAEYLQSYIDLQKQRFGNKVDIQVSMEETIAGTYEIEPMLLIPFVENAFKHGIGLVNDPEIHVSLSTKDGILYFSVANKYVEAATDQKDKTSGIGLTNVKRRLNLLYRNDHGLLVSKSEGWFRISLQLNLRS